MTEKTKKTYSPTYALEGANDGSWRLWQLHRRILEASKGDSPISLRRTSQSSFSCLQGGSQIFHLQSSVPVDEEIAFLRTQGIS